jgi:hypothetical protein
MKLTMRCGKNKRAYLKYEGLIVPVIVDTNFLFSALLTNPMKRQEKTSNLETVFIGKEHVHNH